MLDHVKQMHHMDQAGFNIGASVTAILPMAQVVYIGDDEGRVVSHRFPQDGTILLTRIIV